MKQRSLANSYLSSFCLELYMLMQAGISACDGVLMLRDDEPDKDGRAVLQSVLEPLEKGEPLSEALRVSGYFPRYAVDMTEAGERTGRLAETLKALSEYYDRQDRLATSIKNAVLYPAILLVMMVAVVLILIIRVLPIFDDVFSRLGSQMSPLATRLMQFGGWLGSVSAVIAAIFGLIFAVGFAVWASPTVRGKITGAVKNAFGDRGVLGSVASARFTSVMALAIASGLDTVDAVEMAAAVSGGSKAVDKKHKRCLELLRSGDSLAGSLLGAGILSARNGRMLALGSRSGMADAAMAEIAGRCERGAQEEIDRIVSGVEPALVIITSVIVGVILFSVMLPLMSIMTSIG